MVILAGEKDFTTSVRKAFSEIEREWEKLPGLVITGTHAPSFVDEKLEALRQARADGTPALGICFGMQLMAIEFARNAWAFKDANTTEIDPKTAHPIIVKLPDLRVGIRRVGPRQESWWHNYHLNHDYLLPFARNGWEIVMDGDNECVAMMRKKDHPFFIGTQFHPEYNSTRENPHPLLMEFLNVCKTTADGRRA